MYSTYSHVVRLVCGDLTESPPEEIDGGYGVALICAYLRTGDKDVRNLASEIGEPVPRVINAYKILNNYGSFNDYFWINQEPLLRGQSRTESEYEESTKLWCHIAGISSGFILN